ncbi:MAG: hypothetical protein IKE52_01685 [Mogibacterium sp.]|nr:hypothetical protein [Mogibacterium sp.]
MRNQAIPFQISANNDYKTILAYRGAVDSYADYDEYVAASLKEADMNTF